MKRPIVIAFSAAVAGFAVSLALVSEASAAPGASAAPDVTGKSFTDAQAALNQAGYQVVMSTTIGDRVSQADCIVVRQETTHASRFLGSSQGDVINPSGKPKVLLSLDCNPRPK